MQYNASNFVFACAGFLAWDIVGDGVLLARKLNSCALCLFIYFQMLSLNYLGEIVLAYEEEHNDDGREGKVEEARFSAEGHLVLDNLHCLIEHRVGEEGP